MKTVGIDLERWRKKGLMQFHASRPQVHGLEMHLATIHKIVDDFKPHVVIVDPISNFISTGSRADAEAMLVRLIDFLKARGITALLTDLTAGGASLEATNAGVSSIIDTWLLVRDIELAGERNRGLYVLKSRGMPHSNQIREFLITPQGIELQQVYVGPEGVLTGSMRAAQEAREAAAAQARVQESARKHRAFEIQHATLEARMLALRSEMESVEHEATLARQAAEAGERISHEARAAAALRRGGAPAPSEPARNVKRSRN
jgi:circadian clock protein KaiC